MVDILTIYVSNQVNSITGNIATLLLERMYAEQLLYNSMQGLFISYLWQIGRKYTV